jgi:1-acyl-sn-glycerol-3-phosphate acyltransferase
MPSGALRTPSRGVRARLALQRTIAFALSPLTTAAVQVLLHVWLRLSVEDHREIRRSYRQIWAQSRTPLLICGNHLTMVDSALIAWALGSPIWYVFHFSALPWNTPERTNFAATLTQRVLVYVYKCLPIVRGGEREKVAETLTQFAWLLSRGEAGLIFPEGGRSRSGRVEVESAAYGVGRVVKSLARCRVLCVYLRGDRQQTYTAIPARGDRLRVSLATIEPKTDHTGLRASRDLARQITAQLAEMEREYLDARQ